MLLSLMRKHAKSWLIKFFIAIIGIVFVFYFGYSFTSKDTITMATVNGEVITGIEYRKSYRDMVEAFRNQYKDFWNDDLEKMLGIKTRALEKLINQRLISQEAKKLGLAVTESEIQTAIAEYPPFQINGRFSMDRYQALLANNRMKPEDFEDQISQDLLNTKLSQFLLAFMQVTDQEILDHYTFENESIQISYVLFKPDSYRNQVHFEQADVEAFFREHREEYRAPEQIKVQYIILDPADFKSLVKISEAEIAAYYEYHSDTFSQPKKIRARHILFKLEMGAPPEKEEEIRKKAEEVLAMARKGDDFSLLAKKYSEGPTKSEGGDLGYFEKGQMDKAFEEAAFGLKKGEISDLVRSPFGFHIIKVEDIQEPEKKAPEESREQIVAALIKDASTDLAHEKALSLTDQMPYDANLKEYAAQHGYTAKESGFFSKTDPLADIAADEKLRESLFALEKGDTTGIIELDGKYFIIQVADKKPSVIPELDDVLIRVKSDLSDHLAAREAASKAETILKDLLDGKEWETLLKAQNMKPVKSEFFKRVDTIPEIGEVPNLIEKAFELDDKKRYPDKIFTGEKGSFVIRWEAKKGIDKDEYEKEREQYRLRLAQAKQGRAFQIWLKNLRNNADIEVVTPPS